MHTFEKRNRIVYDFTAEPDGTIKRTPHSRYDVTARLRTPGTATYLIPKKSGGVAYKDYPKQFDRFLNGHLYTFDPDMTRARAIILDAYGAKARAAESAMKNAMRMLSAIRQQDN